MVRRLLGTDEGGALVRSSTDCSRGLLFSALAATLSVLSMSYLEMRPKELGCFYYKGHLNRGQRDMQGKEGLQERLRQEEKAMFIHGSHVLFGFGFIFETASHSVDQASQNSQ